MVKNQVQNVEKYMLDFLQSKKMDHRDFGIPPSWKVLHLKRYFIQKLYLSFHFSRNRDLVTLFLQVSTFSNNFVQNR